MHSSFAIIVKRKRERAGYFAIIVLQMYWYYKCSALFLTVPWVHLQCVIVVFPDHTHLFFVLLLIDSHKCDTHKDINLYLFMYVLSFMVGNKSDAM